ncbi:MAG: hypothetical protein JRE43_05495, partial [Deltaproteobacteria bacterium]|nr:hypothetical protein [Deltaproteobacteria bacterium]
PGAGEGGRTPRPVDRCRKREALAEVLTEVDRLGSVEGAAEPIEEALS